MTEVRFYHLSRGTLEEALPVMLDRTLNRDGKRAVVMSGSRERVEALTRHLWVYAERSFLAHGSRDDGYAEDQPIWLTERDENPNGAQVLFLTDGAASQRLPDYDLVCEIFDGNDQQAVDRARENWRTYRQAGHTVVYHQQTARGGWERKADD